MLIAFLFSGLADARRALTQLPAFPLDIPSPLAAAGTALAALRARKAHAQAEQLRFQAHLQALGIARLERMSGREVLESYRPRP